MLLNMSLILKTVNPLRFQRTAGGTPSGERVKLSDTQKKVIKKKKSWSCHISTESWDSCDFNYVNHFKIQWTQHVQSVSLSDHFLLT